MNRPTITLCLISKNEEKNLPVLLDSVQGCFDEIHLCDTGSTDNTLDIAKSYGAKVSSFEWCDDFSAARNFSIKDVKTDYWMWMDCDDSMGDSIAFKNFRDYSMSAADFWMANYHYAHDEKGNPTCTFVRERIVKTSMGLKWQYPVHEGITPAGSISFINTWSVKHRRTLEDISKDAGRNIRIFEKNIDKFDSRMTYYYGKELFEANRVRESVSWLSKAAMMDVLEHHDRLLCIQYLCFALMKEGNFDAALQFAHQGLVLDPTRAEFFAILGDCYLKKGQLTSAIPMYNASKGCVHPSENQNSFSAVFHHKEAYGAYPRNQLARIYVHLGDPEKALHEAKECLAKFNSEESRSIVSEIQRIKSNIEDTKQIIKTDEYVITCPPGGMYEWDSKVYREYGIGGSETAAVEMSENIHKLTGKKVIIFHSRKENYFENGVEYRRVEELGEYFSKYEPKIHIAWRHSAKLTKAPSYIWCHDLITQGSENVKNYDKILVLSEFHKNFLNSITGIPKDKMIVFRNGIVPSRFKQNNKKTYGKVVFSSSPDRGLDHAIRVMDQVVKVIPEARLHSFYGFDNMIKLGLKDKVKYFEDMINSRAYVIHHGNKKQSELTQMISDAQVWLYPTNFLETYCITALEMVLSQVYPVVRNYGALPYTLKEAHANGFCSIIDGSPEYTDTIKKFAEETISAIRENKCDAIDLSPDQYSWESVAQEFLEVSYV